MRRRVRKRRKSATATQARRISTRAFIGRNCACIRRLFPTITPRNAHRFANMNRRGFWAAVLPSMAKWPIAARLRITMNGKRVGRRAGIGMRCCRISRRSSMTLITTDPSTARMGASKCAASSPRNGITTPRRRQNLSRLLASRLWKTRMGFLRMAISRSPFPMPKNSASRLPWAIWTVKPARGKI